MATDPVIAEECTVCGEGVEANMSALCNWCNGRFHLNQRNDVVAKDCGKVWIDEQYMALQFACDRCLSDDGAEPAKATARPARVHRPRRYRRRD